MKKVILILFMSMMLIVPLTSAWGPNSHNRILDLVEEKFEDNQILEMCYANEENRQALTAGAMIPDIAVVFYYVEGGRDYKLTHNWNFQQEVLSRAVTDDEKCFAYGIAFHLIADNLVHKKVIPKKIASIKVPNWLAHPLMEKNGIVKFWKIIQNY